MGAQRSLQVRRGTTLGQAVKLAGHGMTGGEAKALIAGGAVSVNGVAETRRGRKVSQGDVVAFQGLVLRITVEE